MAKYLTTTQAAKDREYALTTPPVSEDHRRRLAEIAEHRGAFLRRSKACVCCGRAIENDESLRAYELDGLGPICREKLQEAS